MSGLVDHARADVDLLRERLADAEAANSERGSVDAPTATDLASAVRALETIDWHRVPTVSGATAAAFAGLLRDACANNPAADLPAPCPACGSSRLQLTTLRPEPGRTIQVRECASCNYPLHVEKRGESA